MKKTTSCFLIALAYFPVNAYAGFQINQTSSGLFGSLGAFFQQVVDFLQDTAGPATIIVSLVVAIGLWVLAPRFGGGVAMALRATVGGIVLFNIAGLMLQLGAGS